MRLRLPLEGADDRVFQGVLQRTADSLTRAAPDAGRPTLIIELDPGDGQPNSLERCLSLARFVLRDLTSVRTVAYVPRTLTGHAVLIAMACEEIAIAPEAEIGRAAAGENPSRPIEPGVTAVYRDVAGARSSFPPPVAAAMVDRRLELLRVEDETGVDFVLQRDLSDLEAERAIASSEVISAAGSLAVFTGREARELGFAKYLVSGRPALARVLGLPASAVRENQATAAEWTPAIIEINGEISPTVVKRTKTLIGDALTQRQANWLGLRINSGGGRLGECIELASVLAELDPDEVRTVAYVPVEAAGGAALVALACDQVIVHPGAKLGGGLTLAEEAAGRAGRLPRQANRPPPQQQEDQRDFTKLTRDEVEIARTTIEGSLAASAGRSWSLMAAFIDPGLRLHRYTNRETGETAILSEAELAQQPSPDAWREDEPINPGQTVLTLTDEQAVDLGVAFARVDDFDQLKRLYGFAEDPPVVTPNWALELVEALANPWLAGVLLLVGFAGIYIEFHTPGLGIGAFVATVALLLFFWSHFLSGTAEWLEVLLFLVGVFFLLMEAFVLPGLGIFGLGGAAMVLASLVLVSQTFVIPKTAGQLGELRESLTTVVMAMAACLVLGMVFRRYLPYAPGLRGMIEPPPSDLEIAEQEARETMVDYTHLVGAQGVATTHLRPSGRAEIGGELIDVIADGQVIDRGQQVQVTAARAGRVLVKPA